MPTVFVIDRSAKGPSPLVRELIIAGYHTLCMADCDAALQTLRCVRPNVLVVDVAATGCAAAAELLEAIGTAADGRSVLPVLVIGVKLSDYRALAGPLKRGEILSAGQCSPANVLGRVRRYIGPQAPTTSECQTEAECRTEAGQPTGDSSTLFHVPFSFDT